MDIEKIINIATLAGEKILDIYKKDTANVKIKNDGSPVTTADLAANKIICDILYFFKIWYLVFFNFTS